jgi:hypothetical protein
MSEMSGMVETFTFHAGFLLFRHLLIQPASNKEMGTWKVYMPVSLFIGCYLTNQME